MICDMALLHLRLNCKRRKALKTSRTDVFGMHCRYPEYLRNLSESCRHDVALMLL